MRIPQRTLVARLSPFVSMRAPRVILCTAFRPVDNHRSRYMGWRSVALWRTWISSMRPSSRGARSVVSLCVTFRAVGSAPRVATGTSRSWTASSYPHHFVDQASTADEDCCPRAGDLRNRRDRQNHRYLIRPVLPTSYGQSGWAAAGRPVAQDAVNSIRPPMRRARHPGRSIGP